MAAQLPAKFVEMLQSMGEPALAQLPNALLTTAPAVAVRINRAKGCDVPAAGMPVEWCADGYYLPERPDFTLDPALHQGLYYVQDASSMAHAAAVEAAIEIVGRKPLRYLDACASPGGKTTAAMDRLPVGSRTVANEFDRRRCSILLENVAKWGNEAVVITNGDASALTPIPDFFDIIAADVPCSGEGMMRKDEHAVEQWSLALVADCAALQRRIVANLWQSLRPGGCFIYSTCTFNTSENEDILRFLISEYGAIPHPIAALNREEIIGEVGLDVPAYRFLPGRVRGEGQFIALLQKADSGERRQSRRPKSAPRAKMPKLPEFLVGNYKYNMIGSDTITAIAADHAEDVELVRSVWPVTAAGVEVATVRGKDIIPAQPLALCRNLSRQLYPEVEVDHDTALNYLRRNAITIEAPRGIVLLTYGHKPLGWVKNLGNRANNLYPAPWRILKS